MTRSATHRQADVARALRAARKDSGNWQIELLPSGAICIIPCAGTPKQKRLPPPVAHA
jgi:hypothetical protein